MAFVDDVNRILRDFEGYTGDGQGGSGALPVGDRSTARHPLSKRDLRELLIQVAQTLGDPSALQDILDELGDKAPLNSPDFTGTPLVDTAAPGTNTRQAASTAFTEDAVYRETTRAELAEATETEARTQADADMLTASGSRTFSRGGAPVLVSPAIVDDAGRIVARWDRYGNPHLNLRTGFSKGGRAPGGLVFADEHGAAAASFDKSGNPVLNFRRTFSVGGQPAGVGPLLLTDDGRVIADLGAGGADGTDVAALPTQEPITGTEKSAWIDQSIVRVTDAPGDLYTLPRTSFFTNLATLYAQYDALVAAYPDYITRSSLGQDALGNHIYQYVFEPPLPRLNPPGGPGSDWAAANVALPKVILMSGLHGSERTSQLGNLIFATNLAARWRDHVEYSRLRWGARIVIIPAAVPSGVDAGTRPNHNGVDINRNADYLWGDSGETEPGGNQYMGPSAASEAETVILQGLPDVHPDAVAVIDHHNHAENLAVWFGTSSTGGLEVATETAARLGDYLHRQLAPDDADESASYSWFTKAIPGNVVGHIFETGGIDAMFAEEPAVPNDFLDATNTVSVRRLAETVALTTVSAFVQRELRRRQQS